MSIFLFEHMLLSILGLFIKPTHNIKKISFQTAFKALNTSGPKSLDRDTQSGTSVFRQTHAFICIHIYTHVREELRHWLRGIKRVFAAWA